MIQYHPVLTTMIAYFLGFGTGIIATVVLVTNWSALANKITAKLSDLARTDVQITLVKRPKKEPVQKVQGL